VYHTVVSDPRTLGPQPCSRPSVVRGRLTRRQPFQPLLAQLQDDGRGTRPPLKSRQGSASASPVLANPESVRTSGCWSVSVSAPIAKRRFRPAQSLVSNMPTGTGRRCFGRMAAKFTEALSLDNRNPTALCKIRVSRVGITSHRMPAGHCRAAGATWATPPPSPASRLECSPPRSSRQPTGVE